MLPSETMIWQPEFTDKTLSRKPGAVQCTLYVASGQRTTPFVDDTYHLLYCQLWHSASPRVLSSCSYEPATSNK
ncbi:hypothetical protein AWG56_16425 [Escherichia coli]|nr:hypothetical protein AWG56_16425 [Escherichia coli]